PMHSFDGRFTLVYNGEIYNFKEIKFDLSRVLFGSDSTPYPFKTSSDSEVLLAAFMKYGKDCLQMFNGMFSFAIWDNHKKELFITRDRLGVKPLYYSFNNGKFIFSSEIRAIIQSGQIDKNISRDSLIDYLSYQTVHAPDTILDSVKVLMPGHYLLFDGKDVCINRWWNAIDFIGKSIDEDINDVRKNIRHLFLSSVEQRMVSDVPSGAFLSGGIDSTAIVGAMANMSDSKINTFNVSFGEESFSESYFAKIVANKFHTSHNEIKLNASAFLNTLPEVLSSMDHPSGDGPNTFIISKAVREHGIKMALTGLGGDEMFCGYDLFKSLYSLENKWWLNLVPRFLRLGVSEAIKLKNSSIRSRKMADILSKPIINFDYTYPIIRKILNDNLVRGISKTDVLPMNKVYKFLRLNSLDIKTKKLSKYSLAELSTYLPNILLRDADQMSMAVGLELRVPFLDFRLVQYVLSLDDRMKFPQTPKKLLCDSLQDLIPAEIWNRPKMGFTFPWEHWMKNELKTFCEHNINLLSKYSFIQESVLKNLWQRFLKGDNEITWSRIWHLVVLGNWLHRNGIEQ
ncbi:MAG: asparagine synthase (glutamine-hydrolyzing), partial [Bacteroidota bacterium]